MTRVREAVGRCARGLHTRQHWASRSHGRATAGLAGETRSCPGIHYVSPEISFQVLEDPPVDSYTTCRRCYHTKEVNGPSEKLPQLSLVNVTCKNRIAKNGS